METELGKVTWLAILTLIIALWWKYRQFSDKLNNIPGPKGHPLVGNTFQLNDYSLYNKHLFRFAKQFGAVFKIRILNEHIVVLSNFDSIYELLVKKGRQTAGRWATWRLMYAYNDTGTLYRIAANDTWRLLRKVTQSHIKQFGEGMTSLEDLIWESAEDMFRAFQNSADVPQDPHDIIFDSALKMMAFLITGTKCKSDDSLLKQLRLHELHFLKHMSNVTPIQYSLIDTFPLLRHVLPGAWSDVKDFVQLESDIWRDIKAEVQRNPEAEGLAKVLISGKGTGSDPDNKNVIFTDNDAKSNCLQMLMAGTITTSATFYAFVNILAHHKEVQDKIASEIDPDKSGPVTLEDRAGMEYTRAALLELFRYFTVAQIGNPHRMLDDGITIQGYEIPKGTAVIANLWGLHHDPSFWGDPALFRPARFLDDEGHVIPADHAYRKQLMPFGAGHRVCLGETVAQARLFLWMANFVQRFSVAPGPGNDRTLCEPQSYYSEGIMYSKPYSVILSPRQ